MNTSSNAVVMTNREFFRQWEHAALCRIPGVREIMGAYADQRPALEKQYPDAAFALKIVACRFVFGQVNAQRIRVKGEYTFFRKRFQHLEFIQKAIQ